MQLAENFELKAFLSLYCIIWMSKVL